MKLTLPLRSITSHFWSALLNSIWLALMIPSRPRSCSEMASVQRQWAVPSGVNRIWMFIVFDWLIVDPPSLNWRKSMNLVTRPLWVNQLGLKPVLGPICWA
jgi:hypothetical protein